MVHLNLDRGIVDIIFVFRTVFINTKGWLDAYYYDKIVSIWLQYNCFVILLLCCYCVGLRCDFMESRLL